MIYLIPTFAFLLVAVVLRYSQVKSIRKMFTIALILCSFSSFAQSDSLTVGCIAKDTTMTMYTAKSGARFFVFFSPAKKKYYKVFVPRIKD